MGAMTNEKKFMSEKILELVDSSKEPLSGREIYNVLFRSDESVLPGDVATRIWALCHFGILKVRTDLKVVRT